MSYKEGRGWDYKFNFFLRRDETNHSTPCCRMSWKGKMMAPSSTEGGLCPGSRILAAPSRAVCGGQRAPAFWLPALVSLHPSSRQAQCLLLISCVPLVPRPRSRSTWHGAQANPAKLRAIQKVRNSPTTLHTQRCCAIPSPQPETPGTALMSIVREGK